MTWETSETCETVVETYVDHRRSTSWIPNAKEVDRKAPLLGKSAPGSRDGGNIPKPQSTDFSSAFAFEVRNLEQPVSQSALGDKIPYVSCILFSAGGILRCSRFSPSYGEFFELSEVMGFPLNRPYLFGGFSMNLSSNYGWIFPASPSRRKVPEPAVRFMDEAHVAMPCAMSWMSWMSCQGGSLPTWCWAPSLRSEMF